MSVKQSCAKKAQSSMEFLIVTAFVLVIVIIIFSITLTTSDQNIKSRQISESLGNLVQTSDLVYAMGSGTILYADVIWPQDVTEISVEHKCKENFELNGCGGGQGASCTCSSIPQSCNQNARCCSDNECVKYSAVKLSTTSFGELLYASKAKLSITGGTTCPRDDVGSSFCSRGVTYKIKVSWDTVNGFIKLERYTE